MAIRMPCPFCKTSNTLNDDKRGKKVPCRDCKKLLTVPGKKREEDNAIQEKRQTSFKAKTASVSKRGDDDEEDRPRLSTKKTSKNAKKGSPAILLLLGGAAVFLFLLIGVGGVAGFFIWRSRQNDVEPVAKLEVKKDQNEVVANPNPVDDPPNPGGAMTKETIARVKQATVQLDVTTGTGQRGFGSGFFSMEQGLVVTNAHVVGMLASKAKAPMKVEVVLNSGEPNESRLQGQLLGVDRGNDLAVVRVAAANLPAPLPIEPGNRLLETQKVYIFGFPLGIQLGKNITVAESSISSLRKNPASGILEEVQVNGGMHPGNSGGPVVNSQGKVVGISVAVIKGTQINFAIPADTLKTAMSGRLSDATIGEAYVDNGRTLLPVKYACLDPLNRIKEMRIDVWTGMPGQPLPYSYQQPAARAGDGQRQKVNIAYQNGVGQSAVALPTAPAGQVCWLQPVIVTGDGTTHWGEATATPVELMPLERKPANLTVNLNAVKERTVRMTSADIQTLNQGKSKFSRVDRVEVDLLEVLTPDVQGANIGIAFGPVTNLFAEENGRLIPPVNKTIDMLRALPPKFVVDQTGYLRNRISRNVNPKLPPELVNDYKANFGQMCNSLEAVMLPMPNRMVPPLEQWGTKVPMLLGGGGGKKASVVDLVLTCTYEGTRQRNQRSEAIVTLAGFLQGRTLDAKRINGDITGKVGFDLDGGFISLAKLKIFSEFDVGDLQISYVLDVDLDRQAGNPLKIAPPPEPKTFDPAPGPVPVAMVIPGDLFTTIAQHVNTARLKEVDLRGFALSNKKYREAPVEGAVLIGFEYGTKQAFNNVVIDGLRAIYLTKNGEKLGQWQGNVPAQASAVKAKPGYAVSGVNIKSGLLIDSFSLKFTKLDSDRFQVNDTYDSPWAGGVGGFNVTRIGSSGAIFVGIFGNLNDQGSVCSLGLLTLNLGGPGPGPIGGPKLVSNRSGSFFPNKLKNEQTRNYSQRFEAGKTYRITLVNGFNGQVRLIVPNELIREGAGPNATIVFQCQQSALYTIVVATTGSGPFQMSVVEQ